MCVICKKDYDKKTNYISCCRKVKEVPDILTNLKALFCDYTGIRFLPHSLTKLNELDCGMTNLLYIPESYMKLKVVYCTNYVLINPKNYIEPINNKKFLTFQSCQKRYKQKYKRNKFNRIMLYAYYPQYLVSYMNKQKLTKLLNHLTSQG